MRDCDLPPDVAGNICGVNFSDRGDGHILISLSIEDDGYWYEKDFCVSSYWLNDVIKTLKAAKDELKSKHYKSDPNGGYKFKGLTK